MDPRLEILHVLSAFYLRLGDAERALALVGVAAEASPANLDIAETLIRCYIAMDQPDAALKHLDGLAARLSAGRDTVRLDVLRSQALWTAGRRQEARRLYAQAQDRRTAMGGRQ